MTDRIKEKWEMISKYMNEFEIIYHQIANYYNLSDSGFWILYALCENEDGCTQKELYEDWCFNKQTINSSVKDLKNKGYICLEYLDNNKKFKKIKLTEEGKEITKDTIEKVMEVEKNSFENVDEKEMDIVMEFFRKQVISFKNEVNREIYKENIEE